MENERSVKRKMQEFFSFTGAAFFRASGGRFSRAAFFRAGGGHPALPSAAPAERGHFSFLPAARPDGEAGV